MLQTDTTTTTFYPIKWYSVASSTGSGAKYATITSYVFNGDTLLAIVDQQTASGVATGTAQTRRRESGAAGQNPRKVGKIDLAAAYQRTLPSYGCSKFNRSKPALRSFSRSAAMLSGLTVDAVTNLSNVRWESARNDQRAASLTAADVDAPGHIMVLRNERVGSYVVCAAPTVSAMVAPRAPSRFSLPTVVSRAVWCSISAFSSAPRRTTIADIHIHIMVPIAAPSEP